MNTNTTEIWLKVNEQVPFMVYVVAFYVLYTLTKDFRKELKGVFKDIFEDEFPSEEIRHHLQGIAGKLLKWYHEGIKRFLLVFERVYGFSNGKEIDGKRILLDLFLLHGYYH